MAGIHRAVSAPSRSLYLADKSALARSHLEVVATVLGPLFDAADVVTCPIVDLELLFSVRNEAEHSALRAELAVLRSFPIDEQITDRAVEVQGLLAATGQHRVPIADLLISAVAELNDLVVLHYDRDFDTIAAATGQRVEWVAPRGSL